MAIRIVQLGTSRAPGEGLRIGTVRRPPRGVPKRDFASKNWYDVWFPNLAPSQQAVSDALKAATEREWAAFMRRYRAEMAAPDNSRALDLLAAFSTRVVWQWKYIAYRPALDFTRSILIVLPLPDSAVR